MILLNNLKFDSRAQYSLKKTIIKRTFEARMDDK